MYLTDLADACRKSGLKVIECDNWRTRGHGGMSGVRTLVPHHTAGPATGNYPSLGIVRDGRTGLYGPLAQLGLGRDGTVYVIAAGLCYHAGVVRDSSYSNSYAIGIEAEATGVTTWPEVQMDAYARLCAALCEHYDVPVSRVLGHKEICYPPGRKSDPNFDMDAFRARIANNPQEMKMDKDVTAAFKNLEGKVDALTELVDERVRAGSFKRDTDIKRLLREALDESNQRR